MQVCPKNELNLFYTDNTLKSCIGYLRGDFGNGREFYTSWFDRNNGIKTDAFKKEFDELVKTLKTDYNYPLFANRESMETFRYYNPNYCLPNCQFNTVFGAKITTSQHTYFVRCNPAPGDYELYCYCFNSELLYKELSEKKVPVIRFIDSKYNDLFSISDGENITVTNYFGEKNTHNCKFIDEYHTQIDGTVFHILILTFGLTY